MIFFVFFLLAAANANDESYILERSLDGETWEARGSISLYGGALTGQPRVKFVPESEAVVSSQTRAALLEANLLHYRVRPKSSSETLAQLVLTPCSLVRGFEAVSAKEVVLHERFALALERIEDVRTVVGLQALPGRNLLHSSAAYTASGTSCDKAVLAHFKDMRVKTAISVASAVPLRRLPRYDESMIGSRPKQEHKPKEKPTDKDGKPLPEPDERSFFEKYWHYIAIFFVVQIVQAMFATNQKPQEEDKAGNAAATAPQPRNQAKRR